MTMLIKNGTFTTASDVFHGDLRIEEGKITQICNTITPGSGEEVIDAQGLWVLPGGVDVHTHMDLDVGIARSTDDFYTGTVAAACGGTTTIVDHMAFGPKGCPLHHQVDVYTSWPMIKWSLIMVCTALFSMLTTVFYPRWKR
jgi:dihydropyrimidinase (EC 3.5.2.2)